VLDAFANVEIEFGAGRGRLVADGQDFVLDLDDPATLNGVVDRQSLRKLADALARVGLTLRVRSGDRLLLSAGRDVKAGILSRLLRLPGVQLSPSFTLRTALSRATPRPRAVDDSSAPARGLRRSGTSGREGDAAYDRRMARYVTTIESTLPADEAFAYMADFSNASHWDPSVAAATRTSAGAVANGSVFDLVVRFAGRRLPMQYTIVSYDAPRLVVLEARQPTFVSRDTITVTAAGQGSTLHYDALLEFKGAGRVLDPLLQLLFNRTGDKAAAGMRTALNP